MHWTDLDFEAGEAQDRKSRGLLDDAKKDAKQQADFIRKNRRFHCSRLDVMTSPKECGKDGMCEDCSIQRTATMIFGTAQKSTGGKSKEKSFIESVKDVASQESGVDRSQFNFHTYNPRRISKCWAPSAPGISLTKDVLYINTEAIKQFSLGDYARVALLFDSLNNAVLLDFSQDHPEHVKLRVTHRKGGDAKVSLVGFRKNFGVEKRGKFKMQPFSEDGARFLVQLDESAMEKTEEALP